MPEKYKLKNHVRIVTAASLFDGHDATINIIRRILQATGAEVIHLGHNRSVKEIVDCAIQEDAQCIAVTSYQGGHIEFFKYMYDMLQQAGCGHIKIFGGGGGVILPHEIEELHKYGIIRIYSPDDGRQMGLQGMINDLLEKSDYPTGVMDLSDSSDLSDLSVKNIKKIAQLISTAENNPDKIKHGLRRIEELAKTKKVPVVGITGTGGSGKSSLVDEIVRRYLIDFSDKTIGIVSVDPSKRKTGGALLGDRIRMNSINNDRVYMRSLATRQSNLALSKYVRDAVNILKLANFDLILLETSGIGQADTEIVDHSDVSMYVMTPDYGAAIQLEKIDMLDFADVVALNKFDKRGSMDALRDVRKQYARNHQLFNTDHETLPVFGTIASQFNDPGVNRLYIGLIEIVKEKTGAELNTSFVISDEMSEKINIIPPSRIRYLSEITDTIRQYNTWADEQSEAARKLFALKKSIETLNGHDDSDKANKEIIQKLEEAYDEIAKSLDHNNKDILTNWAQKLNTFREEYFVYKVRDKEIKVKTHSESLSHLEIPKIAPPKYKDWGDILKWSLQENFPGEFPYTAGVFPIKREEEDPTRMFAGEGGPERTNKRFHYLSKGLPAKRLSTAFDSVTLYGEDPHIRPDIYGKVGNSGVSICCLDDMKKLYSGFNLCNPKTSVSMTINGPAPVMVGFFMNTAIDQQCELYIKQNRLEKEIQKKITNIFKEKGARDLLIRVTYLMGMMD